MKLRKKFIILISYLLLIGFLVFYGVDVYRFKGPKYQAPETYYPVLYFKQKCLEFKIEEICATGFKNLVRIDVVGHVWYQPHKNSSINTIGLIEYSFFTPKMKISVDRRLLSDTVVFDSTLIHELGHGILNLDHDDSKTAIMNSELTQNGILILQQNYEQLVNEMFKDFINKE